jgi:DNA-binding SARP family transcriptional activator
VLPVPAGKLRVLLAALLVHANDALSYDALGEALWDGEPPPGARATIRNYVKRLRQVLGPVVGARIVTRDPGYLIELANDELDLLRFTLLCKEGGAAVHTGAWPRASARLGAALALWRGAPLVDVPSEVLQRDEVPRLEQIRLQAAEWRIDADLHLGRHAQVVTELQAMASAQPLREGVHRQLMLALAGCGRRAEALDTYRQAATYSSTNSASNQAPNCGSCTSASWPATRRLVAASTPGDSARPIVVGQRAPARPPCPAPPDFAVAVRRRQRSRAGVGIVAAVLAAATTVAAVITNDPAPGPSAVYSRCPIGSFCLFNGKDGSTNYCTWVMSDPVADRDCNWLGLGWTTRSVFNRMSVPVQYCAQEQYKSCVGRTAPGRWGNLAATYTVRSVKAE